MYHDVSATPNLYPNHSLLSKPLLHYLSANFLPHHYIIKKDFKMADYMQHGGPPPSTPNAHFFPSRLSTTFAAYFCRITYQSLYVLGYKLHGKPPPRRPRHRWNPTPPTQFYNLGFRLHFLGIYAGLWAIWALLLLTSTKKLSSWFPISSSKSAWEVHNEPSYGEVVCRKA